MNKKDLEKQFNGLKQEYIKYEAAFKALSDYINPTRGRFNNDNSKRGQMIDHQRVLDAHATQASRILASGLMSGMTDPTKPWIRFILDDSLNKVPRVRQWLDDVADIIHTLAGKSNIYHVFNNAYEEIGDFGTACFIILEDFDDVFRGRNYTIGEYFIGIDSKGRVNRFGREFKMTVGQMVEEFGLESLSSSVKVFHTNKQFDVEVSVKHIILPNKARNPDYEDFENMPFKSVYWESSDGSDLVLAERGFTKFPVIAPRWQTVTTDESFGKGPGWFALGNVKQLQKTHLDKLIAQEKLHSPPMQQKGDIEGHASFLPGGLTRTSELNPDAGVRPAYQINPNLDSFIELINSLRDAIDKDYFVNLFLMISNVDRTGVTATEIAERQQEKIMMLGPVIHRLIEEMLDPSVELFYTHALNAGLLPEPPPEIEGMELKVEYVSILAQAQKALGISQIERGIGYVASIAEIAPQVLDVVDFDASVREVFEMGGMPGNLVFDVETVAKMRDQKAQQAQAAQMAEMANQSADTAKKLSEAETGKGSILDGMLNR